MTTKDDGTMRSFDTGATRDTAEGKLDMEGFTHPMVERQFAKYMNMNRLQSDGQIRDSDNWQKGISMDAYMKSLKRHIDDVWMEHRGFNTDAGIIAALCGVIFNAKGYLLENLKNRNFELQDFDGSEPTPDIEERLTKLNSPIYDLPDECYTPEDVELPICFGTCHEYCRNCSDQEECDTNDCETCDVASECSKEADVELAEEYSKEKAAVQDAEALRTKCATCVSARDSWAVWPCIRCIENPAWKDSVPTAHSYYLHGEVPATITKIKEDIPCTCNK